MKRRCLKAAVVFLAIILVGGLTGIGKAAADEPYNLGVALAITGTGALYCKDGIDAIKLAVDEINKNGGFLGKHPIKLFIRDTHTKPDTDKHPNAHTNLHSNTSPDSGY